MVIFHCFCWWKKSCTTWLVWNPVNNGDIYCVPYQLVQGLFHQQYGHVYRTLLQFQNGPPNWHQDCRKPVTFGEAMSKTAMTWICLQRSDETKRAGKGSCLAYQQKCHSSLDGGNSNIFYFHPYCTWGNDPNLTTIFQMDWLKPPTRESVTYPGCLKWDDFLPPSIISENHNLQDLDAVVGMEIFRGNSET